MPNKHRKPVEKWSMYPSKDSGVSQLLDEDNLHFTFHNIDDDSGCIRSYETKVMGRFRCNNPGCTSRGWGSKVIFIVIRMYPNKKYNARVYHQRCGRATLSASQHWMIRTTNALLID
ncbi:hypothetical protein F5Y19DRAFT_437245 [Xylariaceae sp. FL1651]|nr:hypothetical protein F5Y19DRAFT_437245 [Xylariaceae sp. FL1651]